MDEYTDKVKDLLNFEILKNPHFSVNLVKVLVIILAFVATIFILRFIKFILFKYQKSRGTDRGSIISIFQIIKYIVWLLFIGLFFNQLGMDLTFIIASLAALLVGLGFGIQNIFNDYVSGILLLFEQNVKVGDILEIENEKVGRVTRIGLRTSQLKTRNDYTVVVPNSKLISENTINWSHTVGKTRFHVSVGVAYGTDTSLVKRVLLDCAEKINDIAKHPAPFVWFDDFGNSSLNFSLYFWTNKAFYVEGTKSDLRFMIDEEFKKNNIQIPFPQHDLHIVSDKTKE